MSTIAERKAKYEQSAMKQLMEATGHEICTRCYCCDVVHESSPCPCCGGFEDDDEEWPDICGECGGEGEVYWKGCIGRCDENGEHRK
jgi:hypothetical protein